MGTSSDRRNLHNYLECKAESAARGENAALKRLKLKDGNRQPFTRLIENWNLKDCNYIKRINGLIMLKERRLIYVENWKRGIDSIKKVTYELPRH